MEGKPSKTEKLDIPVQSTERLNINIEENNSNHVFTGALKKGESIEGYVVEKLLSAQTGEAEIFSSKNNDQYAVIKYYHPQFKPKEDILVKLLNIDHPDVITVYAYGVYNGRFYEIMEYAQGGTLADKDDNGTYKYLPMTEPNVIEVLKEVINALHYLHKEGIIHRDIKPSNLFFKNGDGTDILIGDFGISSELDVEGGMSKRMTSTLALSEGYAAPELYGVAKDDSKAKILIGPEVDYYALGMTIFELLTAKNIFAGRNTLHVMRDTIEGRVTDDILTTQEAKQLSPRVINLIRGLLTVRHDKRWGYNEVVRWLKGEDVEVFIEASHTKIPTLKFGDKKINSLTELAKEIDDDRELGKKYLMRGLIEKWAMKFDESLANDIIDIKELTADDNTKILSLLYQLDSSIPCKVDSQHSISNIEEFIRLLKKEPELMSRVILENQATDLFTWLTIKYKHSAKQLLQLSESYKKSGDSSLDNRIRIINSLYIALAGDHIQPFNDDYTIDAVYALLTIPDQYKYQVLDQLHIKNSILYLFLTSKISYFEKLWSTVDHTWDNFIRVIKKEQFDVGTSSAISKVKEIGNDGRFISYSDRTVLDTRTNLMWAAQDSGSDINWSNAKSYCKVYQGGNYTDWRIPAMDELKSLYDKTEIVKYIISEKPFQGGAHLAGFIDLAGAYVWSSNMINGHAVYLNFLKGRLEKTQPSESKFMRALPVRSHTVEIGGVCVIDISHTGTEMLMEFFVTIEFDGKTIGKDSLRNGFHYSIKTVTGAHVISFITNYYFIKQDGFSREEHNFIIAKSGLYKTEFVLDQSTYYLSGELVRVGDYDENLPVDIDLSEVEAKTAEPNTGVMFDSYEAEIQRGISNYLLGKGIKVGEVKQEGMVEFGKLFVLYFAAKMNGYDGWVYALLGDGEYYVHSTESGEIDEYNEFKKMPIVEKKQYLRNKFKQYANFSIPDGIQFKTETIKSVNDEKETKTEMTSDAADSQTIAVTGKVKGIGIIVFISFLWFSIFAIFMLRHRMRNLSLNDTAKNAGSWGWILIIIGLTFSLIFRDLAASLLIFFPQIIVGIMLIKYEKKLTAFKNQYNSGSGS